MNKVFPDEKKNSGLLSPSMACAKRCRIKGPICNRSILPLSDCQLYTQQEQYTLLTEQVAGNTVFFFLKRKKKLHQNLRLDVAKQLGGHVVSRQLPIQTVSHFLCDRLKIKTGK